MDDDGCSDSHLDDDEDGVFNDVDVCADTPANATVNASELCRVALDSDGDGVTNDVDLCLARPPTTPSMATVVRMHSLMMAIPTRSSAGPR
ncbi:MAG: hypothetical protein R3E58_20045 [Phycisphaerae bacterium]